MTVYRHTQIGWVVLLGLGASAIALVFAARLASGSTPLLALTAGLLALGAWLFGSLTTQIRDGILHVRFGPGLVRKRFTLERVTAIEIVRNHWLWGWGIRYTPRGWLYNVSGLDAVELTLLDGKRVRVGTDRPQELARALREAIELHSAGGGRP